MTSGENALFRECGSTLYVGLTGRTLIQKSTGMDPFKHFFFSFFPLGMSRASDNTKTSMKKKNMSNPLRFLSCRSMTF